MITLLFFVLLIGCFAGLLIWGTYFPTEGRTHGIVERVETETDPCHGRKGHHSDPGSYRVYVRYKWHGVSYLAKSFKAYGTAEHFPGDQVVILVHKKDKLMVNIIG